jgi:uncharacterized protein (TIGR00255 family)
MILSMTGYGTGSAQKDDIAVTAEIKTVNHRFLDLHIRMPREHLFFEGDVQQIIRKALDRGRVEVNISIQNTGPAAFAVNSSLARGYLEAADSLRNEFHFQDSLDLKSILSLPGIIQSKDMPQIDAGEILPELLNKSVNCALEGVLQMRRQEGEALRVDMVRNLSGVKEKAGQIRELSLNSSAETMNKLRERIAQLLPQGEMDPQRLAQEAALLADRSDISEEIARLGSHIQQYHDLMNATEKAGKKLDFLLQELQREANTILSKSANLEVSRHAIAIKADIEKLREQVQNVE